MDRTGPARGLCKKGATHGKRNAYP